MEPTFAPAMPNTVTLELSAQIDASVVAYYLPPEEREPSESKQAAFRSRF